MRFAPHRIDVLRLRPRLAARRRPPAAGGGTSHPRRHRRHRPAGLTGRRGAPAFHANLFGRSAEARRVYRLAVLGVTLDDLRRVAALPQAQARQHGRRHESGHARQGGRSRARSRAVVTTRPGADHSARSIWTVGGPPSGRILDRTHSRRGRRSHGHIPRRQR